MKMHLVGFSVCLLIGLLMAGCQQTGELPEVLTIVSRSPDLNATGVDYREDLSITFKFPIEKKDLSANDFFIAYGSDHSAGTPDLSGAELEWSPHQHTATISGIGGWSELTIGAGPKVVEIVVGSVQDIFGNDLREGTVLWKFILAGIGGVATVYPVDGATAVPTNSQIRATFSEAMDPTSINASTFTVSGSTVTGSVSYDENSKTAIFTPSLPLAEEHTYVATIAASVKDINGNEIGTAYTWSFTTADETTPSVLSVSPANAATDVSPASQISITFDEDMDASTINSSSITLSTTYGAVSGSVSYDSASRTATFVPDGDLQNTLSYTATVASSVADAGGNGLVADYSWSFTIRDLSVGWTKTYTSSGANYDVGTAIANGSVYVAGYETVTLPDQKTNIWLRKYDNASGNIIWTRTHDGPNNYYDYGYAVTVDGTGNVYLGGTENVSGQGPNIWLRKYDSSGNTVWTATHNGSANNNDQAKGVATDSLGNVYVVGFENVSAAGEMSNIWVRKYDSSSNEVWTRTHNGSETNSYDYGNAIAVDGGGNVYVAGAEHAAGQYSNIWVRKYDSSGNTLWTRTFNGAGNDWDYGNGVAVDDDGNVYVIGEEAIIACADSNIWLRKYDSAGNIIWTKTHDGPANGVDSGQGVAVDSDGNVYAVGYEEDLTEKGNIWIRKYDSDGNVIWTKTHNGSANEFDAGYGISLDNNGNVYVTGKENVTTQGDNIWVRKYTQ